MKKLILLLSVTLCLSTWAEPSVVFDVALSPAGSFKGKTAAVKGNATQKGDTFTAANIVVDLKTIKTGIEVRDQHTLKHLEVEKFPEAVLVSATGKGGKGEGVIKIRGIEQKISGTYKINGANLDAEFPLKLSDFKINGIRYMGVGVKDEIKLHVSVPVKK